MSVNMFTASCRQCHSIVESTSLVNIGRFATAPAYLACAIRSTVAIDRIVPTLQRTLQSAANDLYHLTCKSRVRRRQAWTDNVPRHSSTSEATSSSCHSREASSPINLNILTHADKGFEIHKVQASLTPESDVSRLVNEPHDVPELPAKFTVQTGSQTKHPAQSEWEALWYHGVSASFQKIAHYFPSLQKSAGSELREQNIAEPTLDVSSLKAEEQAAFAVDESQTRTPFAPTSHEEVQQRLLRAETAIDERQRLAALLGLPTFAEYITSKRLKYEQEQQLLNSTEPSKRQLRRQAKFASKKEAKAARTASVSPQRIDEGYGSDSQSLLSCSSSVASGMTQNSNSTSKDSIPVGGAEHRPLVIGLKKPTESRPASTMASSLEAAAVNKEIAENVKHNTAEAGPAEEAATSAPKQKKEKAPKQPKPQKQAAPTAPTSPALIDLRVGHILRAIAHPNADSLYVSTIAMGDAEGTEHTQVDEETGKVVRTVCSGLNGLVPLEEMQNRKIIVVANLKPVNMRSIKSAAMVLAASPKAAEGADPHAPDRVVELVSPPEGAEAGDKVYFEGWPYGEGKGPEKVLNPKKKQWEAIQPGFYTSDDLVVGFDASQTEEVEGSSKGDLVVEGKGKCTVKTLKGAVVR